jgi:hypothetical protein
VEINLPKVETATARNPFLVTGEMEAAGLRTLNRLMRGDSLIHDFKAPTLRMIVREIYLAMVREK